MADTNPDNLEALERLSYLEVREPIVQDLRVEAGIIGGTALGASVFLELAQAASNLNNDAEMLLVPIPAIVAFEFLAVGALVGVGLAGDALHLRRQKRLWNQ